MEEIRAAIVLEMMGRPKSHLEESLRALLDKLSKEEGVDIINKKTHEPLPMQESEEFFTTFAEVEIKFDNLNRYLGILFAYMPSNVEIFTPEKMILKNSDFNDLGNSLMQRLHNYDSLAKRMLVERDFLLDKLKEISPEEYAKITTPPESSKN